MLNGMWNVWVGRSREAFLFLAEEHREMDRCGGM
jgi:hypothetical protein